MSRIELDKATVETLARQIATYLRDELEVEVAPFDAVRMIDFLSERLGPHYYNQGLTDAQSVLKARMDSIVEAIDEIEKPVKR
jgi:uncharacterized protein (DUF2164 family)